jgi:hypothetical protein
VRIPETNISFSAFVQEKFNSDEIKITMVCVGIRGNGSVIGAIRFHGFVHSMKKKMPAVVFILHKAAATSPGESMGFFDVPEIAFPATCVRV